MENKTIKSSGQKSDGFLWFLIILIFFGAIFANYYFRELAWSLRFASWIFVVGLLGGVTYLTGQGKRVWAFIKEARAELHKVTWPTKDETIKTTAIVAVLVLIMAIVLWILDSILLWVLSLFTR